MDLATDFWIALQSRLFFFFFFSRSQGSIWSDKVCVAAINAYQQFQILQQGAIDFCPGNLPSLWFAVVVSGQQSVRGNVAVENTDRVR